MQYLQMLMFHPLLADWIDSLVAYFEAKISGPLPTVLAICLILAAAAGHRWGDGRHGSLVAAAVVIAIIIAGAKVIVSSMQAAVGGFVVFPF